MKAVPVYARVAIVVTVSLGLSGTVAGCESAADVATQGPTRSICGTIIGRAMVLIGSGPFYVDASRSSSEYTAAARSSPTWVQVSDTCDVGVPLELPLGASVGIADRVRAADGSDVAVRLTPKTDGTTKLVLTHPGRSSTTVTIGVTPTVEPSPAPSH